MNRKPNTKSHASTAAMLSAGFLLAPGASAMAQGVSKTAAPGAKSPTEASAMSTYMKYARNFDKWHGTLSVVGMLDRRPVFKTEQGEFFQVDPNTGDLKFHTAESLGYIKMHMPSARESSAPSVSERRSASFIKFDGIKGEQRVSVRGVDAMGNVIQENSRGERFYLGPNGDMVFVK